jgi:hypothetical protein
MFIIFWQQRFSLPHGHAFINLHIQARLVMLPGIKNKKLAFNKLVKPLISDKVKGCGNDPFFVKKANQSKEFPEKPSLS